MIAPALEREIVRLSLEKAGLTIRTSDAEEFVVRARKALGFLHWKNLRSFGSRLDKDRVRALGMRANTKLSIEFIGILNDAGLADSLEAANTLAQTIEQGVRSAEYVLGARDHEWPNLTFVSSRGAAGPCPKSAEIEGQPILLSDAVFLPVAGCDRMGQCFCMYAPPDYRAAYQSTASASWMPAKQAQGCAPR